MRLTRRRLLALVAGIGLSACTSDQPDTASPSPSPTSSPSSSEPHPPQDRDPEPEPEPTEEPAAAPTDYEPIDGDVHPDAKRVGGRFSQALTTYAPDEPIEEVIARAAVARRGDLDPASLVTAAAVVHRAETSSTGEVVYAQLGGLDPIGSPTAASTMVVVTQRLDAPAGEETHTRTIDVRLRVVDGSWVLDSLGDAGGEPVDRPASLPAAAVRVLDDERIDLPDSARWDIHRGEIDERLLTTMADMAELFPYAVCCLKSGHPINAGFSG